MADWTKGKTGVDLLETSVGVQENGSTNPPRSEKKAYGGGQENALLNLVPPYQKFCLVTKLFT